MRLAIIHFFLALGLFTSGCTTMVPSPKIDIVNIDEVLNEIKDELNAYLSSKSSITPAADICFKGSKSAELLPTKVTLTLTTVQTNASNQTLGAIVPFGVFLFDPSLSANQSNKKTQTLVIPLAISNDKPTRPVASKEYLLATSIMQFRDALLKVDHSKTPCLAANKETKIKLTLAFNVVRSASGGFKFSIAGFKLGDTETRSSDATQTLELEFGFTGDVIFFQPA